MDYNFFGTLTRYVLSEPVLFPIYAYLAHSKYVGHSKLNQRSPHLKGYQILFSSLRFIDKASKFIHVKRSRLQTNSTQI